MDFQKKSTNTIAFKRAIALYWNMIQYTKWLPYNQEDLSTDPNNPRREVRCSGMLLGRPLDSNGRQRQTEFRGSMTCHPLNLWVPASVRESVSSNKSGPAWNWTRPLHVGDGCVAWSVCRTPDSRTRIYPWCISWLFRAQLLLWDALFSLDAGKRDLVFPQLFVPDFIDSAWDTWPFLDKEGKFILSGWTLGGGERGKPWLICKINKK